MKIEEIKVDNAPITYPYLGVGENESVVLFTEKDCGVLLKKSNPGYFDEGKYLDDWVEGNFNPYKGKITLEND